MTASNTRARAFWLALSGFCGFRATHVAADALTGLCGLPRASNDNAPAPAGWADGSNVR